MLLNLKITNIALIEDIEIQFNKGLNILSGETGAGKSIILDSLALILGEPGKLDLIRHHKNEAKIHALFDIEGNDFIKQYLYDNFHINTSENLLIIERHIFKDKPTVALINHQRVLVQALKDLGVYLIDIHSQHQSQQLFNTAEHIRILDRFAHLELEVTEYQQIFEKALDIHKQLKAIHEKNFQKREMEQFYEFTLNELTKAELSQNELSQLEEEIQIIANIYDVKDRFQQSYDLLYNNENAIISQLQHLKELLQSLEKEIPTITQINPFIDQSLIQLEPVLEFIKNYKEQDSCSPKEFEQKKYRYSFLKNLEHKYKKNIEELIEYQEELTKTLEQFKHDTVDSLEEKQKILLKDLEKRAKDISVKRIQASQLLEEKIQKELSFLKLNSVQFKVQFHFIEDEQGNITLNNGKKGRLLKDGIEKVEFLISFNQGQELKPLTKIASGGEISRVMLALKSIFHQIDVVSTQIFDEIDTGIGGETASAMAQKLRKMSHSKQLICITHLAQIAAMGDLHYQIKKILENQETQTIIVPLTETERISEISRMLSGELESQTSRKHAEELLALKN